MSLSKREPETGLPTEIDLDGGGGGRSGNQLLQEPFYIGVFFFNANDRNLLPALYCFSM